jgi:DNA-binding IclR family transcriptional regulator
MTRFQRENKKVRILKLVHSKSTGTPSDLAEKLGISIRSVKRFIHELREAGYLIRYCRSSCSYISE